MSKSKLDSLFIIVCCVVILLALWGLSSTSIQEGIG